MHYNYMKKKHLEIQDYHLPAAEGKIVTSGVSSASSGALY
jgi:hypothetical protein